MATTNEQLKLNAQTPRWTPDDDLMLAEAVEAGISLDEIAEMMGRTTKAVSLRIVRLRGNKVAAAKKVHKSRKAATMLRRLHREHGGVPAARKVRTVKQPKPVTPANEAPQQEYGVQVVVVAFVAGLAAGTSLFAIITGAL